MILVKICINFLKKFIKLKFKKKTKKVLAMNKGKIHVPGRKVSAKNPKYTIVNNIN